eukprot:CAMPEP_0179195512 /NCGR_PEP_ID=MMETSP0796-20121207/97188_1 /TAXON_ID=73915 /ORGANISM="Pyrodinium bahamense, Strain pbaha01" /LENGTH=303 /DNA_ID=CAMNT_0020899865 /DNA_START=10 /DNA_END=918 /DNA_ORIENTATION=-
MDSMTPAPAGDVPAHLNCTAKHFVEATLRAVVRHLHLAGAAGDPQPSLAFHFDAGRSQPEGGGRAVPGPLVVNASNAAAAANCSAAQMLACAGGIGGLASLEGLAEYLVGTLERGAAQPTPAGTAKLGWGPLARALSANKSHVNPSSGSLSGMTSESSDREPQGGLLQLGGGSGAGFQIVCGDKGLATLGGGGGGGAFGRFGSRPRLTPSANESLGGGGGGGVQLFFPAQVNETPWGAARWISWGSGGGSGCGSCKKGDKLCEASLHGITCGAKMDDGGAINATAGREVARLWRIGVLRRCYE